MCWIRDRDVEYSSWCELALTAALAFSAAAGGLMVIRCHIAIRPELRRGTG